MLMRCQLGSKNSNYSKCIGMTGGAIAMIQCDAVIEGGNFEDCSCFHAGGGVAFSSMFNVLPARTSFETTSTTQYVKVEDHYFGLLGVTFSNCISREGSGAVDVNGCPEFISDSCKFLNCAAGRTGGAITFAYCRASIVHSLFKGCLCGGKGTSTFSRLSPFKQETAIDSKRSTSYARTAEMSDRVGGGAIYCRNYGQTATEGIPYLITDRCCFVGNLAVAHAGLEDYQPQGNGFDICLVGSVELWSAEDRFWNKEDLSISIDVNTPDLIQMQGTRFWRDRKFKTESACDQFSDVHQSDFGKVIEDIKDAAPMMMFVTKATAGLAVDDDISVPVNTLPMWDSKTPRATDYGRTLIPTLAELPDVIGEERTQASRRTQSPSNTFSPSNSFTPAQTPVQPKEGEILESKIVATYVASMTMSMEMTEAEVTIFVSTVVDGMITAIASYTRSILYRTVHVKVWSATQSLMFCLVKDPDAPQPIQINTTLLIGLVAGTAAVVAIFGASIVWFIRNKKEHESWEYSSESSSTPNWAEEKCVNSIDKIADWSEMDDGYLWMDEQAVF